jgi:hypothetical protein
MPARDTPLLPIPHFTTSGSLHHLVDSDPLTHPRLHPHGTTHSHTAHSYTTLATARPTPVTGYHISYAHTIITLHAKETSRRAVEFVIRGHSGISEKVFERHLPGNVSTAQHCTAQSNGVSGRGTKDGERPISCSYPRCRRNRKQTPLVIDSLDDIRTLHHILKLVKRQLAIPGSVSTLCTLQIDQPYRPKPRTRPCPPP